MRVLITGGAGLIGQRLARRLLERGALAGSDGREAKIEKIVLADTVAATGLPSDPRLEMVSADITDAQAVKKLIDERTRSVFHLAAVVSGHAEADTDVGYRVNLDGTRNLLEACRATGACPRFVFTSSVAVYGGDVKTVGDDTALTPQTSYGNQKACGELLVNDFSRKGYVDGRSPRLPTIIIRPGKPNRAASSWASSVFREPLSGVDVVCPVTEDTPMAVLSVRKVIAALERIHDLPGDVFGYTRTVQLPAIATHAAEMIAALKKAGGDAAVSRVRWEHDPAIQRIVSGWPKAIVAPRAEKMGFSADASIDAIVAAFVEDDLPAQRALVEKA